MPTRVRAEMPGSPALLPRESGWWIGVLGLVALCARSASLSIIESLHAPPAMWGSRTHEMHIWVAATVIECAIAVFVLARRAGTALADRAGWLVLAMVGCCFAMAPLLMIAGKPFRDHLVWLIEGTIWVLVFALGKMTIRPTSRA